MKMSPSRIAVMFVYLLVFVQTVHLMSTREQMYRRASHCPGMVLAESFRYQTFTVLSRLLCVAACLAEAACVAVVHESGTGLCHLGSSAADSNCANMVPAPSGVIHYQEEQTQQPVIGCQNGGTLDAETCICAEPYYGEYCEKILRDCSDVETDGYPSTWITHVVRPKASPEPFAVRCNEEYKQTFIFQRTNGLESFNRPWQDYVTGFGDMENSADFWIGLDRLHQITDDVDKNYALTFAVTLANWTVAFSKVYPSFRVSDAASGYSFTLNATTPNLSPLEDCLTNLAGHPFSASDNDQDGSPDNCASLMSAGWWYADTVCSYAVCTPFGRLTTSTVQWSGLDVDAYWATINSGTVSVAEVNGRLTVL